MSAPEFLEDVGPMGDLYRRKEWSATGLGPPEAWSRSLRGYVDMILRLPSPTILFWGPDQIQLYNLGYSHIMGPRHPRYLGEPYRECWPDTYPTIYPMMRRVMDEGAVVEVTDALIPVTRFGFTEETYFSFSFVPLRGDDGRIEGFIQPINETTTAVLAARRLGTLRALAPRLAAIGDAMAEAVAALRANDRDLPFAAVYVAEDASRHLALAARVGLADATPALLALAEEVRRAGAPRLVDDVQPILGEGHLGPWPETARAAMVMPLQRSESDPVRGVIVLGVSPRLRFDDTYRAFFTGAARELASALAFEQETREKARLHLELQRRAEALTELDRAKTAFFSNVSHELRTPLTLMLGPVEDALEDDAEPLGPRQRERVALVQRSGGRLFKLVNTLLDFSRIEAGRMQASFEPVDLATLTAGLAGTFRSIVEGAGLTLDVDCPPLPEPVWVDCEMWEKVVLNLVSNAFKFTFAGRIAVRLTWHDTRVELGVSDTGTGIPAAELPRLFDRFHRVEGAKSRSYEGSGIGLALVQELVHLHGGGVRVQSEEGRGTTFTVSLLTGDAHLLADRRRAGRQRDAAAAATSSFVREASAWMDVADAPLEVGRPPPKPLGVHAGAPAGGARARVLLADDNQDMRDYVRRLLEPYFEVEAVADGAAALAAATRHVPALVLTDVMMPGLDGFGLLAALKRDPRTHLVPVILLSARAGEESRIEGMQSGADDYLVKPFAARELLARVGARLEIARLHAGLQAELARRVDERTAQLQEANREMESFSYSVSHDLRAPLRHILGFSELLERHAKSTLDAKSREYVKVIAEAAQRGGQLVDDLLAFSRMGRAQMLGSRVELGRLMADVRAELAPEQEGRQVTWRVHSLPVVTGDPALLRLVFKNLLSNALKYSRPRAEAVIEVGSEPRADETEIWVKDNGVGFDMRYVDKLFSVFQRLHTAEQFDGTGIGLALVRRVISRHGGRTWAEGVIDKGATVHFTLPRAATAAEPTD